MQHDLIRLSLKKKVVTVAVAYRIENSLFSVVVLLHHDYFVYGIKIVSTANLDVTMRGELNYLTSSLHITYWLIANGESITVV